MSFLHDSGTSATRRSPGAVSLGTAMRIGADGTTNEPEDVMAAPRSLHASGIAAADSSCNLRRRLRRIPRGPRLPSCAHTDGPGSPRLRPDRSGWRPVELYPCGTILESC